MEVELCHQFKLLLAEEYADGLARDHITVQMPYLEQFESDPLRVEVVFSAGDDFVHLIIERGRLIRVESQCRSFLVAISTPNLL